MYSYTLTKYFGLYKEIKLTRKSLLIRRLINLKKSYIAAMYCAVVESL